jgi:hypothetical protein
MTLVGLFWRFVSVIWRSFVDVTNVAVADTGWPPTVVPPGIT